MNSQKLLFFRFLNGFTIFLLQVAFTLLDLFIHNKTTQLKSDKYTYSLEYTSTKKNGYIVFSIYTCSIVYIVFQCPRPKKEKTFK